MCLQKLKFSCFALQGYEHSHACIHPSIHHIPSHPSIPFHSIPFHSIPFHSIPFHSIPFHSIHSFIHSFIHYLFIYLLSLCAAVDFIGMIKGTGHSSVLRQLPILQLKILMHLTLTVIRGANLRKAEKVCLRQMFLTEHAMCGHTCWLVSLSFLFYPNFSFSHFNIFKSHKINWTVSVPWWKGILWIQTVFNDI